MLPDDCTVQAGGLQDKAIVRVIYKIPRFTDDGCITVDASESEDTVEAGRAHDHLSGPTLVWTPGRRFQACYQSADPRYTNIGEPRTFTVCSSIGPSKVRVLNDRGEPRMLFVYGLYNFQWLP
jgi:hypothetical protein